MYKYNSCLRSEEIWSQLKSKLGGLILFLLLFIFLLFSSFLRNITNFYTGVKKRSSNLSQYLLVPGASEADAKLS